MNDNPTLVQFYTGWKNDGETSEGGLPQYRETVMIRLERPPYLQVSREATEEDIDDHPEPYRLFEKEQKAKKTKPAAAGFPLAMWPVINEFHLRMFAAKDVYTVEQLAKLAKRKDMPPDFIELAERAAQMVTFMNSSGKHEATIRDLTGQIEALKEQVDDAMKTIAAQKEMILTLKMKVA